MDLFDRVIMQSLPFEPMLEGAKIKFVINYTQWYNLALYKMPANTFEKQVGLKEKIDSTPLPTDYYGLPDPVSGEMPPPNLDKDPRGISGAEFLSYLAYTPVTNISAETLFQAQTLTGTALNMIMTETATLRPSLISKGLYTSGTGTTKRAA